MANLFNEWSLAFLPGYRSGVEWGAEGSGVEGYFSGSIANCGVGFHLFFGCDETGNSLIEYNNFWFFLKKNFYEKIIGIITHFTWIKNGPS